MITKFQAQKTIYDVKEFREIRKAMGYFENTNQFNEFTTNINNFLDKAEVGLEVFNTPELEDDRNRKNIFKYVSYLNSSLPDVNPDLISDLYFLDQLKQLDKAIKKLIEDIE